MTTPVIFRKWKKSSCQWQSIIAIFPTDLAGPESYLCTSYEHIGQHGACDYRRAVLPNTKLAKPEEYAELMDELVRIGYTDLVIYQRWQPRFTRELDNQYREQYTKGGYNGRETTA